MTPTVVLEPAVAFATIAAAFHAWDGGPTDQHAWLAGEPIGARWTRGDAEVLYSANPAIGLRVLTGQDAGRAAGALPVLSSERARVLAASDDPEAALLGITAVGLYGDLTAAGELEALAHDDVRPQVSAAAELALRRLGIAALQLGADHIAQRRRQAPDRDPILGLLGPAETRRQLIRWMAAHPPQDRTRQLELVRAALHDDDWEVRWSGVIAAYDLALAELLAEIKRCRPAEQAHRVDRQILDALREVVGYHLAGTQPPIRGEHLHACLDGTSRSRDRAWLLIGALRRPLPVSPTAAGPTGFCTVPAILHWVGDPDIAENPVRAVVPEHAVTIAEDVHGEMTAADLPAALAALSAQVGEPLRLPTATELEMAVRGPDGRRYPWGNGRRQRSGTRSPWGLLHALDGPEWVEHDGAPMALGAAAAGCAGPLRRPVCAGLRPAVGGG